MSNQVQIQGRVVNGQQLFTTGNFRKQTLIVEVVNGNYTSYLPVEFHNADIDTFLGSGQVQSNQSYTFTCWVQGSNQQFTDKNGQPTAYISLKVSAVAPAQSGLPQTTPATAPQTGFGQPAQGGFVGQPTQPTTPSQGFGSQQQGGFAQPANPSPQQTNPFGANNGGFGQAQ